jgi:CheY-like chemotaxis protein
MLQAAKVLVVDDSLIFRDMLKTVLSASCETVLTAASCAAGKRMIDEHRDLDLVLSDVVMPDASGFVLLEYVGTLSDPRPQVILVTARPEPDDAKLAVRMGAAGYLSKPVSMRDVVRVLRRNSATEWNAARRVRRRSMGRAFVSDSTDEEFSQLVWDIRDLSVSGAFLESRGPVPIGTDLNLSLVFGRNVARVRGSVVRIQEPSWENPAGVGVGFSDFEGGSLELLEGYVADAEGELF